MGPVGYLGSTGTYCGSGYGASIILHYCTSPKLQPRGTSRCEKPEMPYPYRRESSSHIGISDRIRISISEETTARLGLAPPLDTEISIGILGGFLPPSINHFSSLSDHF